MGQIRQILVADDEVEFLFSASVALRGAGYRVMAATNGREAFARIVEASAKGDPVHVLVTDQQMPGMTGTELAESLRALGFRLPIVIVTAFHDPSVDEGLRPGNISGLMEKPIGPEELVSCLKRMESALYEESP